MRFTDLLRIGNKYIFKSLWIGVLTSPDIQDAFPSMTTLSPLLTCGIW